MVLHCEFKYITGNGTTCTTQSDLTKILLKYSLKSNLVQIPNKEI